jgi:hypothetical protein
MRRAGIELMLGPTDIRRAEFCFSREVTGMKASAGMNEPLVLSIKDTARLTGLSPHVLYRRAQEGKVPEAVMLRLGTRIYFRRGPLMEWLGAAGSSVVK